MAGIGIERNIRDDAQFGKTAFQCCNGARHQTIRVERLFRTQAFQTRINDGEQRQSRNAQSHAILSHRQQQIDRKPLDAGHGTHRFTPVLAIQNKHRINQIIGRECVLTHQAT